jgi:DNA-binding response OmpR family regulator
VANLFHASDRRGSDSCSAGATDARILVVDDDYQVRQITRTMLEQAGFDVLQARDPSDTLKVIQAAPDPVDLALIDINLPGMDGRHLAVRIANLSPTTRILYMSGVPFEALSEYGVLADSWFIQKPFTMKQLLDRVNERLGRSADG